MPPEPVKKQPTRQEMEEQFRESLKDALVILKSLAPYCTSFDDLAFMVETGTVSDGQMRLLMEMADRQVAQDAGGKTR